MELFDLSHTYRRIGEEIERCQTPWEMLERIAPLISSVGESEGYTPWGEGIWLGKGVRIHPSAVVIPPCVIGDRTELRPGAYLRGDVIVGRDCVVGHDTEVKNSILFDGVQAPHFNYIGDSILGHRVHLGAGVVLSNLRLDREPVVAEWDTPFDTKRRKVGALVGDNAQIACGVVINPGKIIKKGEWRYPT